MDIGAWLGSLGLTRYETAFRENSIHADVVGDLTESDLAQLGVTLGDRKRLLRAIAAFSKEPAPKSDVAPSPTPAQAGYDAERRPITVMFCDLVGSTTLAAHLDAEDWRELVNDYLDEASKAVSQFGGHVLKKLGDGLMALFGYPRAQENDAERAARAGLAILRALDDLNARNVARGLPGLAARIGLETGPVVVDGTGEVFGDAPNVAARVQSAAEPGTLFVTAAVQRHVAGLFVAEDKGPHELKGVPGRPTLYRLVRASGGGRRAGARSLTPLVGREEELAILARRWERATTGDGQFVQIVGEPGLGKSRLIEEFRLRLGETPHTWVEWSSSQLLQNTPLHPIAEWGRQRFMGEAKFADLEAALAQVKLDPAEYAPLLAPLLDVRVPAERELQIAPDELRRRQLEAVVAWLLAGARSQPLVLAFEDLHWADPTTLDLMKALAERSGQAPLLIVVTARPEFRASWATRSHHSVVSLAPLDRTQIAQMVGALAERHALSRDAIEGLSDRTAGVPLFVEELTRLMLEGGAQTIPPTLQQSLAARLDRLGEAREVAQIGAVLGREFSRALLRRVSKREDGDLEGALAQLTDADLLYIEGTGTGATYRFKHALIQDAAYDSLLKKQRQALHARAADALVNLADPQPELVAHHFTQSGQIELACEWWGKAGEAALRRSAFQEAVVHLGKAIEKADQQTAGSSQNLHAAYGNALLHARGYDAIETAKAFARGRERAGGDLSERLAADYGLWAGSYLRGELPAMREHARSFLGCVGEGTDLPEAGVAHRVAGVTHWFAGEYTEAREHLEQALTLFRPGRDDALAYRFGHDAGASAMILLALVLWPQGEIARANSLAEGAVKRTASLGFVGTHGFVKAHTCMFALMRGDLASAAEDASQLSHLARDHDLPMWQAFTDFCNGLASGHDDGVNSGLESLRRGAEVLRERNVLFFDGLVKIALANAEARAGNFDRAIAAIEEALVTADRTDYRAFEAELHRTRGEMLLKRSPRELRGAEDALFASINTGRQQVAHSFELLVALPLARLLRETDRFVEAHDVLASALEGLVPTPQLPPVSEAQALLAELEQTHQVVDADARRQRRLHLQTAYGHAVMMVKGFASDETKAAFASAAGLSAKASNFSERFAAAHGQWTLSLARGELRSARTLASAHLNEAEEGGYFVEAGVARRGMALICLFAAEFAEARKHCEEALRLANPERDRETRERFGDDTGTLALSCLAVTMWELGEVDRARDLIEEANRRAREINHAPSMAHPLQWLTVLEVRRGDAAAALISAEALAALGQQNGMPHWALTGQMFAAWARGRMFDASSGADELRRALKIMRDRGGGGLVWAMVALLAELEAETLGVESALARFDEAEALAGQVETHLGLPLMYLMRGDLLLKCSPFRSTDAEDAFRTALAISKRQGARTCETCAAFSLARFLYSLDRPIEAHDVLAPALEGFSPTPELPAIAEAQALLAQLKR